MSEIKSALEIALARTENIKADKSLLEANAIKKEGNKLVSDILFSEGEDHSVPLNKLKSALKSHTGKKQRILREGAYETLKANLSLPRATFEEMKWERLKLSYALILNNHEYIPDIFQQLGQFFQQYMENKKQLREGLEKQYAPRLKQKEEELSQQVGSTIHLDALQDPEFMKILKDNMDSMDKQYQTALNEAKEELNKIFASQV